MTLDLNEIDNIIFDLGGVLIDLETNYTFDALEMLGGIDIREDMQAKIKFGELFTAYELGQLKSEDFFKQLGGILEITTSIEELFEAWNKCLLDIPEERMHLINLLCKES